MTSTFTFNSEQQVHLKTTSKSKHFINFLEMEGLIMFNAGQKTDFLAIELVSGTDANLTN